MSRRPVSMHELMSLSHADRPDSPELRVGAVHTAPTGIDNSAYTNVMVAWVLRRAADALRALAPDRCDVVRQALGLTAA